MVLQSAIRPTRVSLPGHLPPRPPPRRATLAPPTRAQSGETAYVHLENSTAGEESDVRSTLHVPSMRLSEVSSDAHHFDRRTLLKSFALGVGASTVGSSARAESGDWSSPGLAAPEDPDMPKFVKLDSGVRYQILREGKGEGAAAGDSVEFDYVLRRANGYFIYSTVDGVSFQPRDLPTGPVEFRLGSNRLVPGIEDALSGMREGGRRRVLVPANIGYDPDVKLEPVPPGFAARRQVINHRSEPLIFEIEVLKIRRP